MASARKDPTPSVEEQLLEAEAIADAMVIYLDDQEDPHDPKWSDPRAIADMMCALIKNIRLGLIAESEDESLEDLLNELRATLQTARRWMGHGAAFADDDLPALSRPGSGKLPPAIERLPMSQRETARPPPGFSVEDLLSAAPKTDRHRKPQ